MTRGDNEYRLGTENPVAIIELGVTSWCNYTCNYCVTTVHRRRASARHAFDFHPVDRWIAAFERIPCEFSLLCRGGEPFLDHEGFARFLTGLGAISRLAYLRVDTNGAWSPGRYESVPRDIRARVQLNVSFHPTQITLEQFEKRLDRILEAGWQVPMINYVLEAGQASSYPALRDHYRERGIYVNPNPDVFDAAWQSRVPTIQQRARHELSRWLPPADLERKTGLPTRGKSCSFPAIAYFVEPTGTAERACGITVDGEAPSFDFLTESARVRPLDAQVSCPMAACFCLDRYAFLDELPHRGQSLNLLGEYVRDCVAHQAR